MLVSLWFVDIRPPTCRSLEIGAPGQALTAMLGKPQVSSRARSEIHDDPSVKKGSGVPETNILYGPNYGALRRGLRRTLIL